MQQMSSGLRTEERISTEIETAVIVQLAIVFPSRYIPSASGLRILPFKCIEPLGARCPRKSYREIDPTLHAEVGVRNEK